jgi:hypothetical protein
MNKQSLSQRIGSFTTPAVAGPVVSTHAALHTYRSAAAIHLPGAEARRRGRGCEKAWW